MTIKADKISIHLNIYASYIWQITKMLDKNETSYFLKITNEGEKNLSILNGGSFMSVI